MSHKEKQVNASYKLHKKKLPVKFWFQVQQNNIDVKASRKLIFHF